MHWIRGDGTCDDNIIAYKLARNGANLDVEYTDQFCGFPIGACKNSFDVMLYKQAQKNGKTNNLAYIR